MDISNEVIYNNKNDEILCIHCNGWGKVPINQKYKEEKYITCKTCNGKMLIEKKIIADVLGSSSEIY